MKILNAWAVVLLSLLIFTACNEDDEEPVNVREAEGTGKASIYLTDAPVDNQEISAVFISITGVEAKGPEGWINLKNFDEPVSIDLLSYQNGESFLLIEEQIAAGTYTEVRLNLNIQENGGTTDTQGSYIQFKDGSKKILYTPGGEQTGYKAIGGFTVPENGNASVTLDFDVRKALVAAGKEDKYLLKPAIRLVANGNAGTIEGELSGTEGFNRVVAFVYQNGAFSESEMDAPTQGNVRFANAISSSMLDQNQEFTLAYLNTGTYDVYFAMFDEHGEFLNLLGSYSSVKVGAQAKANISTKLDELL